MTKVIYKYQLFTTYTQTLELPAGAKILKIHTQYEQPCIWAEVDLDTQEKENRTFITVGTGHTITHPNVLKYISTYFNGPYVFHVYEELNDKPG